MDYHNDIIIHQEAFSGTNHSRPERIKLWRKLKKGDTLVFDSCEQNE